MFQPITETKRTHGAEPAKAPELFSGSKADRLSANAAVDRYDSPSLRDVLNAPQSAVKDYFDNAKLPLVTEIQRAFYAGKQQSAPKTAEKISDALLTLVMPPCFKDNLNKA